MNRTTFKLLLATGLVLMITVGWMYASQSQPEQKMQFRPSMKNLHLALKEYKKQQSVSDHEPDDKCATVENDVEYDEEAEYLAEIQEEEAQQKLIRKLNAHQGDPAPILPELWSFAEKTDKKSHFWFNPDNENDLHPYHLLLRYCESHPQQVTVYLKGLLKTEGLSELDSPSKESSVKKNWLAISSRD